MSRLTPELLSSIIGDIYDCAINPSGWSAALSRITLALDAAYTTISMANPVDNHGRMAAQSPWDPEQLRILNEDYGIEGVPGLKLVLFNDVDEAWSTLANMPEPEFQKTPFYQNWAKPQGLRDACLVKFVHTADRIGIMGCITRSTRDIIGPEEQAFMAQLSPHLRRAALIGDLLDQARIESRFYQSTLDRLLIAIVLTDETGTIRFANAAAENMFAHHGPILRTNGKLKSQNLSSQSAIQTALARASKSDQSLGTSGIGIPVSAAGRPAAVAYVLPLAQGTARASFEPATVAVFVSTTTSASPPPDAVLTALFDLTPAEARVALATIGGLSKQDVLKQFGVSENTLKTHLSRVYKKTETNNLASLAKLISSIGLQAGSTQKQV